MNKQSKSYLFAKRFLDIATAVFALIMLAPLFLLVSCMYLIGPNRGPIFYRQLRIGYHHKPFYIYKFRSMVVDAENKLYSNPQLYHKFVENGYKLPTNEDPRITTFGAFLRQTSIDELPQFINILRGDMSIIGPRPIVESELVEYGDEVDEFLSVKPGAMGLWQATGRSTIQYPQRAELELTYAKNANLWFDFKIIFKTVMAIFKRDGAM
ncbi:sugar transferase [Weissella halotolerans]|uniref:Undecaprenyl-phosphate galactose phosphotransferase n=1 Tax=Weissella halotolerans DSM 20190 TaxID=1123500 RepID=A0A0R2G835_9LACO|nr:sugar transferase [Weissella halotolerans]KRN33338.1 undecaprenyl-phosphate galactose phosphotransferase [Weissella halotolerans DSM 20190]